MTIVQLTYVFLFSFVFYSVLEYFSTSNLVHIVIREYAYKLLNIINSKFFFIYLFLTLFFLFSLFSFLSLALAFLGWDNYLLYCDPSLCSSEATALAGSLSEGEATAPTCEAGLTPTLGFGEGGAVSKDLSSAPDLLAAAADTKATIHLPNISVSFSNTSIRHNLNIILTITSLIVGYQLAKDIPSIGGKIIAIIGVVASAHLVTAGVNFIGDILSSYNF